MRDPGPAGAAPTLSHRAGRRSGRSGRSRRTRSVTTGSSGSAWTSWIPTGEAGRRDGRGAGGPGRCDRELEVAVREARRDLAGTEALARGGEVRPEDVAEAREEVRFVESRLRTYREEVGEADWQRAEQARHNADALAALGLERDARQARLREAEALRPVRSTPWRGPSPLPRRTPRAARGHRGPRQQAVRTAQADLRRVSSRGRAALRPHPPPGRAHSHPPRRRGPPAARAEKVRTRTGRAVPAPTGNGHGPSRAGPPGMSGPDGG